MKIEICGWKWKCIYKIRKGTLVKGNSSIYRELRSKCGNEESKFGCYAWKVGHAIKYIGSFSKEYTSKQYKSNLQGRIMQYWYGNGKTNKRVLKEIKKAAKNYSVMLYILRPGKMRIGAKNLSAKYSQDRDLVLLAERLFLYYYRSRKLKLCNRG